MTSNSDSSSLSTDKTNNISGDNKSSTSSVIDQSLLSENPGSYEDLHKKTKGKVKLISSFFFFFCKLILF